MIRAAVEQISLFVAFVAPSLVYKKSSFGVWLISAGEFTDECYKGAGLCACPRAWMAGETATFAGQMRAELVPWPHIAN
jgi:hypothetical protein